ncbi:MAG: hypothetical protein LBI18_15755 [Planctomycetaceae bacterium]|jgi:hypothetical protein|nr:hypothetical protein [Planctomycetaceae bacterium]
MFYRILFLVLFLQCLTLITLATAQEVSPPAPESLAESLSEPPRPPVIQPVLPRMNPAILLRMRQQLTFELQQTQRTLGFIDPNDKQLAASLQEQQAELTNQLKEINTQLKAQGIPIENQEPSTELPTETRTLTPKTTNIVPETTTPLSSDPNLLIQRRENSATGSTTSKETQLPLQSPFQSVPGFGNSLNIPAVESGHLLPTPFDQDQAWSDSPWVPKPSKELAELKQTVDSLRKEITDLKETVKALETQIQLLNRNILLSQPK